MNVGENTTLGDGDVTQQLVQLLIVADGKLEVTRDDTGLLVVAGGIASQLENLSSEVLEDGSQVDGSTSTDTLGIVALAEETVNTADGERQTSLGGTAADDETSVDSLTEQGERIRDRRVESGLQKGCTHDCALLEPLALPPDLPPVILKGLGGLRKRKDVAGNQLRRECQVWMKDAEKRWS